jgi:uncharacterized alkaline shock family protein YloU
MLLMAFVSLCIIVLPFNAIPLSLTDMVINELYSKWYYTLIGLILFAVSIKLLFSGVRSNSRNRSGIIKPAEYGDIRVSIETFESLAMRVVKQISGIKDAKVKVYAVEGDLIIHTSLLVLPDINIPKTISDVQSKIKSYIEHITEVGVKEVKVDIENVAQVTAPRVS